MGTLSSSMAIPFNKPVLLPEHLDVLKQSLCSGHISGIGPFTKKCESALSARLSKDVRLVTSATHALELMALLLNIQPGDEVIVPSFTFVSTANAFALRGARIRFADNDEFGNLMPSEVERLRSPKTRAVVTVHYAGASADMDSLLEVCRSYSIPVLEDAAQAIGAEYKGHPLGTLGILGCLSFHETKNITCGEGGALIFGDPNYLDRSEILREKGTNRSQFFQGLVDKYTWTDIGSSYVLSDLNAAYLYPQIEQLVTINAKREKICKAYVSELHDVFEKHGIQILKTPAYNTPNYHLFAAIFPSPEARKKFITFMKSQSIICPFHYISLHTSPFGRKFSDGEPDTLPGCEHLSQNLVRLPLYYNMSDQELTRVIEMVKRSLEA